MIKFIDVLLEVQILLRLLKLKVHLSRTQAKKLKATQAMILRQKVQRPMSATEASVQRPKNAATTMSPASKHEEQLTSSRTS